MNFQISNSNWYKMCLATEVEYLSGFIELTEVQILNLPVVRTEHSDEINVLEGYGDSGYASEEVLFGVSSSSISHEDLINRYFPDTIRRSTLVTIWSRFVDMLRMVCQIMKTHVGVSLGVKEIQGSELEQVSTYLIKVIGTKNFRSSELWRQLAIIHEIRNLIVHQNGRLPDLKEQTKKRFLGTGDIAVDGSSGAFVFGPRFNDGVIEKIRQFLHLLEQMTGIVEGRSRKHDILTSSST